MRAARALLRWEQKDLAAASGVSLPSLKRLETQPGTLSAHARTIDAIEKAFNDAGVVFLDDGALVGGGSGVRLAGSTGNE